MAAITYGFGVRHEVPSEELLPAPAGAEVMRRRPWTWKTLLLFPFCAAAAWLADWFDLGGAFIPGQFLGTALANLAGAVMVGRWQREHTGEVLIRYEGVDEPELYVDL